MSPSLSPPCPWKVRRHLQPRPGGSCGHRQLQASLPPQGSSQHLPTAATFPRRGTPCVLLCSQSHPLCPLVTPPQTRSLKKKPGQGNLFSSPNSKIYFNCCNTVDYKQLLCVTEHVQVAGCIVGRLVPAAGPPLGCPLPQPGKGHHGWGHREKGQPRLARRCRGAGSDAAEHLSSWTLLSLGHSCIRKRELQQFSVGRPGATRATSD